jgi:hypothetical protein
VLIVSISCSIVNEIISMSVNLDESEAMKFHILDEIELDLSCI